MQAETHARECARHSGRGGTGEHRRRRLDRRVRRGMGREREPRLARCARGLDPLDAAAADEVGEVLAVRRCELLCGLARGDDARPRVVRVFDRVVDGRAACVRAGGRERSVGGEERRAADRHRVERVEPLEARSIGKACRAGDADSAHGAAVVGSDRRLSAERRVDRGREIPVPVVEVEPDGRRRCLEPVAGRRVLRSAAEVVLPEHARDIARRSQQLRQRDLRRMELHRGQHRIDDRGDDAGAEAMASGEHCGARRRALGRRPKVSEAHAVGSDLGEDGQRGRLGRRVPAERRERHLVDAEVVDDDDEDVRGILRAASVRVCAGSWHAKRDRSEAECKRCLREGRSAALEKLAPWRE